MFSILRTASDAGQYGTLASYAIRNGWTIETIYLYARIAGTYANLAMKFAEGYERKRTR